MCWAALFAQRLAKLDKRTQRAMFELARQEEDRRLKESADE